MNGPALILVAGWAHTPSAMNGLAAQLSEDSMVITCSTNELWLRCRDPLAVPSCADGLVSLIRDTGSNCIVVGWSMGGMVALETVAHHPGLVSSLVLVAATARFCSGDGYAAGVPVRSLRAMLQGLKQDRRLTLSRFFEQAAVPFAETSSSLKEKVDAACLLDPRELRQGLVYLEQFDMRSCLARIDIPVLVFHGRKDKGIGVTSRHSTFRTGNDGFAP